MSENPKLRSDLVIVPVELEGQKLLMFQDPNQWCEEIIFMPIELAPFLQFFDGAHSVREIQEQLMRLTGQLILSEDIERLIQQMDSRYLLDSENFRAYVNQIKSGWEEAEIRPEILAGRSYPLDPIQCKKFMDDFYLEDGPGIAQENSSAQLKGIVAPHIELRGNGGVYAYAYKKLFEESQAELFLIFGTAHFGTKDILVFSEKHFQTPLGIAETDREFIQGVRRRLKKKGKIRDFSHRREHSIELQALFLTHLFKEKRNFKIVPILVGSFQELIEKGISPMEDPLIMDYVNAIKEEIKESGKKTAVIASADLAHLGPRYGDKETYAPIREEEIKEDDRKMLQWLEKADSEGFIQEIAKIKDRRKICGLGPIYLTFKISEPSKAEILKWSVWYDQSSRSAVSFCAIAVY